MQIITAGARSDDPALSRLSEAMALGLMKSGAEIYEYQRGMIHAKITAVDNVLERGRFHELRSSLFCSQ